jgi:DHA2 family multidrug resistance protein-like MFS transporter
LNRPQPTSAPLAAEVHDGLGNPQRLMAFSTLAMAITMAVLDGNIVTVALPTMARQFAVAPESATWIINAFQLAVTVSLLPLAALGDMYGYRRVYWWGLAVFTVASLACALAPTFAVLTFARLVQGLGAAGIMSVNIALIRFIYPHSRLGQGVGNMAVVVAVASAASPSVAAAILSVASWHWLFLVNVPIGALALVMAARTLPATPRAAGRLDLISVVLNALAFGLFIAGVNRIGQGGSPLPALIESGLGAAIGVVLVKRQLKLPAPLLPVDLLRRPVFALSLATSITSFGAQSLAMVALPFYFEDTLGRSAAATGLLLTPWPVATALIAGRLADRFIPGILGSIGLLVMGAGLALVALHVGDPDPASLVWRLAICGLGFGFFQSPNNRLIIGSAPRERSGGAAGLQSTGRLIGQSLGTALMAVAFGRAPEHATQIALWGAAALALAGACASGLRRAN